MCVRVCVPMRYSKCEEDPKHIIEYHYSVEESKDILCNNSMADQFYCEAFEETGEYCTEEVSYGIPPELEIHSLVGDCRDCLVGFYLTS